MLSRLCGGSSYSHYGVASIGIARMAQGDVADMYARDMPLIVKKFPQLQETAVNNETMAGVAWRWEHKQTEEEALAAVWESDCAPVRQAVEMPSAANQL